jgi:hypothetical protein
MNPGNDNTDWYHWHLILLWVQMPSEWGWYILLLCSVWSTGYDTPLLYLSLHPGNGQSDWTMLGKDQLAPVWNISQPSGEVGHRSPPFPCGILSTFALLEFTLEIGWLVLFFSSGFSGCLLLGEERLWSPWRKSLQKIFQVKKAFGAEKPQGTVGHTPVNC